MQSTTARIGVLAAVVAAAAVLFIVLSGDDDDGAETATTTATASGGTTTEVTQPAGPPVITVRDGKPVGGVQDLTFEKGDRVRFDVRLDQPAEEVHVHGYDLDVAGRHQSGQGQLPGGHRRHLRGRGPQP